MLQAKLTFIKNPKKCKISFRYCTRGDRQKKNLDDGAFVHVDLIKSDTQYSKKTNDLVRNKDLKIFFLIRFKTNNANQNVNSAKCFGNFVNTSKSYSYLHV